MDRIISYLSFDGISFPDRFKCARYELQNIPNILEQIKEQIKGMTMEAIGGWAGGDPRRGYEDTDKIHYYEKWTPEQVQSSKSSCCNGAFANLKLTYEHWKIWFEEFYQVDGTEVYANRPVSMYLMEIGPDRYKVVTTIRKIFNLSMVELGELLDNAKKNLPMKTQMEYHHAAYYAKQLEELGATIKVAN